MNQDFELNLVGAPNAKNVLSDLEGKAQREAMWTMPFDNLVILPDFNVREHDKAWEERVTAIQESMVMNGYLKAKPFEVFVDANGRAIVTDGHTRHEAARRAIAAGAQNLSTVFVVPRDKGTSMEDLTIGLVESNSGAPLSALALSLVVKRLVHSFKNTAAEAAKKIHISPKYANQMLLLAGAPQELRDMIEQGKIAATLAIEMLEEHGDDALRIILEGSKKVAPGKRVTKKNVENPETKVDKLIAARAKAMYQLVEMLLSFHAQEEPPQDKISDVMDKLDLLVTQVRDGSQE